MDDRISANEMQMLVEANQLTYSKLIDGSFTHTRQYRTYNFSPNNFTSGDGSNQLEIVLGSGSDFVYGPNSYLKFKVQVTDGVGVGKVGTFAKGKENLGLSAMNLFKTAEFTHRSGDILDRTAAVNVLAPILMSYGCDESLSKYYSGAMGGIQYSNKYGVESKYPPLTEGLDVCIPLWFFSGLWGQEVLMPGLLTGAMRMRLEMESFENAIVGEAAATKYKITGMAVVLDSYILMDSVVKELMLQSQNTKAQGLQYTFTSHHHLTKKGTPESSDDLNYAAGQVLKIITKRRLNTDIGDKTKDSISATKYQYAQIQARLGSLTYPRSPITTIPEAYQITLQSFDQLPVNNVTADGHGCNVGVAYADYADEKTDGTRAGVNCLVFDFEKNQSLRGIGELTNNSRLCTVEYSGAVDSCTVDYWIQHVRVVNIMQDNIVLDR